MLVLSDHIIVIPLEKMDRQVQTFEAAIQHKLDYFVPKLSVSRRIAEFADCVYDHWAFGSLICQVL